MFVIYAGSTEGLVTLFVQFGVEHHIVDVVVVHLRVVLEGVGDEITDVPFDAGRVNRSLEDQRCRVVVCNVSGYYTSRSTHVRYRMHLIIAPCYRVVHCP